jgi:putative hydrolase of the HAD superfamily
VTGPAGIGAVVLDFFGTLTDPSAELRRRASFTPAARALGVPPDDFRAAMSASFGERIVGRLGGTRSTLRVMAERCGVPVTAARLDAAVAAQEAAAASMRPPRPGALAVLAALRGRGLRLGVLSDCSSETCRAWPRTPYAPLIDAAVFSWQEGYRKPDPRLYATVSARLGVPPARCLYVGDGGSRELRGARAAGMTPVLVTNAAFPGVSGLRDDADDFRPDLVIDDLTELPALLGAQPAVPGAPNTTGTPGE